MDHLFPYPKMGHSWLEILHDPLTRRLVGYDDQESPSPQNHVAGVHARLAQIIQDPVKHLSILKIGYSGLEAFLQSNCTGPPIDFDTLDVVIPPSLSSNASAVKAEFSKSLEVDGIPVYSLTPHLELFWLAKVCMSNKSIAEAGFNGRRARFRLSFVHQRLLLEKSDTLKEQIYTDADILHTQLSSRLTFHGAAAEEHFVEFLMERAAIRTYYGDDVQAREDLLQAAKTRKFQFALSGALGKRTKFQDRDLSQLVVLARSRDHEPEPYSSRKSSRADGMESRKPSEAEQGSGPRPQTPKSPLSHPHKPENVLLNDDTLLEAIRFKQYPEKDEELSSVASTSDLPSRLVSLDPSNQPLLFPTDSIILLAIASTISTTSPADSLTREETLPYATRVLEGGSSNWQVYTQALLVRSRIEGYKSRTAERGLLQLQALVDQVIAETSTSSDPSSQSIASGEQPTTFLPKPTAAESASVAERLKYIYQLSPPLRWELESELASRWVSMGGLKTALEIYERLQMHAEVALCLAATDREAEAVQRIKNMLFDDESLQDNAAAPKEKTQLPTEAPRLYCILGDITQDISNYERAWAISNGRYSRAQRSLGRYHMQKKQYTEAAAAYKKALEINRLNASTWFALGCVQLELDDWSGAVESFSRCVRENDDDAEAWSNLAVALLRLPENEPETQEGDDLTSVKKLSIVDALADENEDEEELPEIPEESEDEDNIEPLQQVPTKDTTATTASTSLEQSTANRNTRAALIALKRAAQLKREDARIWDNYLTVAASIPPPYTPWRDIILAQKRVIELRSKTAGEACIDETILSVLVEYVTTEYEYPADSVEEAGVGSMGRGGIPRMLCELIDVDVVPLITSKGVLWTLVGSVMRWRRRPGAALEAAEKGWRVETGRPGVYESSEEAWEGVVEVTVQLVGAYEELGGMQRERTGGKVVEGDWRFKGRSAVRGVMGKGKATWEGSKGWKRLEECLAGLKSG